MAERAAQGNASGANAFPNVFNASFPMTIMAPQLFSSGPYPGVAPASGQQMPTMTTHNTIVPPAHLASYFASQHPFHSSTQANMRSSPMAQTNTQWNPTVSQTTTVSSSSADYGASEDRAKGPASFVMSTLKWQALVYAVWVSDSVILWLELMHTFTSPCH
jgi:hypothetical protein